jgi:purine-nucleoside phosphorylase
VPTTSPGAPGANPFEQARIAARELGRMTGADRHDVLIVLGTGLFAAAEQLGARGAPIDLTSLPWFARFTGPGHRPEAWSVVLEGKRTLIVAGRLHLYEGRSPPEVVHPVRTAVAAGARTVVLTCSAGAVNPALSAGDIVAIRDHLNLTGTSPLVGVTTDGLPRSRHVDMTDAWSPRLRALARAVTPLQEGVYAQMPGPQFETPAEIRMLAALGADLVGMSTVPEAIAARHLGAEVLGLAVVTNAAAGTGAGPTDPDDVVRVANGAAPAVAEVVAGVVRALDGPGGAGTGLRGAGQQNPSSDDEPETAPQ